MTLRRAYAAKHAAAWRLLVVLSLPVAGGCAAGVNRPAPGPAAPRSPPPAAPAPAAGQPGEAPAGGVAADPGDVTLAELDRMLALWDAAQAEGQASTAQSLRAELTKRADAELAYLTSAARGARGQAGVYVATMALGFSSRPEATVPLVERLADPDPRLVSNALIALRLRADPATPLAPLTKLLAHGQADVRRYAPLAFASVLEARRRAGIAPDALAESAALPRLLAGARDRDALVRLHVARALGATSLPEAQAPLVAMLQDGSQRVALAAANGLAARGDPEGFAGVVALLHAVPGEAKPMVAAVLVDYAGRLQGRPLTAQEQTALGTSSLEWSRWHGAWLRTRPAVAPPTAR